VGQSTGPLSKLLDKEIILKNFRVLAGQKMGRLWPMSWPEIFGRFYGQDMIKRGVTLKIKTPDQATEGCGCIWLVTIKGLLKHPEFKRASEISLPFFKRDF